MSDLLVRAPRASAVDVVIAPKPFTPHVEVLQADDGLSVAQLLLRACTAGALSLQDLPRTEIYIDGLRLADRAAIREIYPRAGETVNIVVLPQGGGNGGRKNPLEMALQLAVMVAAFAIAGPAGPLASPLAGAGIAGLGASAIEVAAMASINLIGAVALRALFGPPASDAQQPQYSLENSSNQARQRQMMPLCAGERRWAFDQAATAFSTVVGSDTYMTVMFGCHYGPCTVTDLKIGETLAGAYPADELQIEQFLTPGPRNSTLYPTRIDQQSLQDELDPLHADWSTATSGIEATRIEIDFYWPQLIYTSSSGEQKNQDSVIYMEYSPYGANQWQPVPGYPAGTDADGNAYPAGSLWIQEKTTNPTRQTVGWDVPLGQYDVRVGRRIRRGGDTSRSVDDVTWTALRTINTSQPAIADENLAVIVLKAKASQDFSGSLGVVSGVVTPVVPIYDATAKAWTGDPTTYDATGWQPSSNAVAIARYMLTGYPAAKPLTAAQIDSSLASHFATIETMDWHGGLLLNSDVSQEDALVKLGKLGRCYFYWNGSALCCAPDYEKPAPRQVFSGRNAQNYQYKRVFPDPVHAVYVQFSNADEDWKDDGVFVYNDGYTSANATLIEGLQLDYACTTERAKREGRVYLAKLELLTETHQWTAGVDSIASTFGDRVAVRHISTLFGIGEARVQFRRWQGQLIAGVRLDTAVTFEAGKSYTIDTRRSDQVIRGLPLATTAGTTRDLVFAVPVAEDDAPAKGDLVVVGETGVVTEDVEIIDISPKPDGTADIVAQSYRADDIVAAETGTIAALQSALTARVAAPVPVILGANGDPNGVVVAYDVVPQRQATIAGFTARWRRSPDEDATATWNTLPMLSPAARTVQTPALPDAQVTPGSTAEPYQVDVEIRTVLATGEVSQPAQALNIVVQKGVLAPTNFAALGVARTAQDGSSYPAIQVDCDPLTAGSTDSLVVELQPAGSNPTAWRASACGPFAADVADGDLTDVLAGAAYDVRARWRTSDGWYSDYVTQLDIPVPAGALVAYSARNLGDRTTDAALAALDQAVSDIADQSDKLQDAAEAQLSAALQSGQQLFALHAAGFTPDGLPMGPTLKVQQTVLDTQVTDMELLAIRSADGTSMILNVDGVWIDDDGTTISQKFSDLSSATDAVSANLSENYLTAAETNEAIAEAELTLQASIDGVSSDLSENYYTSAQTDQAIAIAQQTLQASIDGVSSTLTDNYYTSAETDQAIATASQTLQSSVDGVSSNLSDNYLTSAQTDQAIASAEQSLQSSIDGVSSTLTNDYYTSAQVDQAISAAERSLQSSIDGVSSTLTNDYYTSTQTDQAISEASTTLQTNIDGVSGSLSETASVVDNLNGNLTDTYTLALDAGGTFTGLQAISSTGPGDTLSEIIFHSGDLLIEGKQVFDFDTDTGTLTLQNIVAHGNIVLDGTLSGTAIEAFGVTQTYAWLDATSQSLGARNSGWVTVLTSPSWALEGHPVLIDGAGGTANTSSNHDQDIEYRVLCDGAELWNWRDRVSQNSAGSALPGGSQKETPSWIKWPRPGTNDTALAAGDHIFEVQAQLLAGSDNESAKYIAKIRVQELKTETA